LLDIGDKASRTRTVTEEDIVNFAEVSGDHNSVHLDEEYAKNSIFGKRIAHGMLGASFISCVLANDLPGDGTIYLSQSLRFLKPISIGDEVISTVEVLSIEGKKVKLSTTCSVEGDNVIEGEAIVLFSEGK
jgi:3-hydroxybutyryl-CoA dehydratase|tara:strand:+ start:1109 stop:1501 length:393 start_codon:yes stop_codon:yes gene_type:complete